MDIERWQTTAADNDVSAPDGWPEGMSRPAVNDSARENMAAIKRFHDIDAWRDPLLTKAGAQAYVVSKDSDTVVRIAAGDLTGEFPVGRRVRLDVSGTPTAYGFVTAVAFSSPDTLVTIYVDPEDDGTTELNPAIDVTFDAAGQTITAASGTPFADVEVGDQVKVDGSTLNDGFLLVSVAGAAVLTVNGPYSLVDEGPVSASIYRIDAQGKVPAGTDGILVAGTHAPTRGAFHTVGANPLNLVRHKDPQDGAYQRTKDMVIDAEKLDGYHANELVTVVVKDADHVQSVGTLTDIAEFTGIAIPGSPDGAKLYRVRLRLYYYASGGGTSVTLSFRGFLGPDGTSASDTLTFEISQPDVYTGAHYGRADYDFFITPAADDLLTLAIAAHSFLLPLTIKKHRTGGSGDEAPIWRQPDGQTELNQDDFPPGPGTFMEIQEVTRL